MFWLFLASPQSVQFRIVSSQFNTHRYFDFEMEVHNLSPTPEVLDLCVRKRPHSPDMYPSSEHSSIYDSATCQYSPVSNSDSESCEISSNSDPRTYNLKTKGCRPFKAYIKDPLMLAQGLVSTETLLRKDSSEAFNEFRKKIMEQVQATNTGTNKNMRRMSNNGQGRSDDPTYWEKRRKNNEAAKRSRDARRAKEDEIAIRCAFLERENCYLKFELEKLQKIIYLRDYHRACLMSFGE